MKTTDQVLKEFGFEKQHFSPEAWSRLTGAIQFYRDQFKKGKRVGGVDECYQEYVKIWTEAYPALGFNAVGGKVIKSMIASGRKWIKDNGKDDTRERVLKLFEFVIAHVKKENHFCHNKPLTTWNGQYLSIIAEIKNGKQRKPTKSDETREFLDSLRHSR